MNQFLELLTVPIAAGGQNRFELAGDYFEIIDSQYPITVLLEDRNGAQVGRMAAAETSFFMRNTPYAAITVSSANAQTIRIAYGSGEAGTRRTAGVVQVVDGGKARSLASQAFIASVGVASTPSTFVHVQLWNPAGSSKNLIVGQVCMGTVSADTLGLFTYNAAIPTFLSHPKNKRVGAADSVAEMRFTTNRISLGTQLCGLYIQAISNQIWKFLEPIVLPPGQGLIARSGSLNATLNMGVEFYEEAI